jgi:hypothetical protein
MKDSNEFASNCLGCIKTFSLPHFREPPDGMVTAIVVLIMVIVIELAVIIEVIARIMKCAKAKQKSKTWNNHLSNTCYSTEYWTQHVVEPTIKALSSDKDQGHSVSFDTDSHTVVVDNAANCHICNDKRMFIGKINEFSVESSYSVDTVGGGSKPKGIGTVLWMITDDAGKRHEERIDEVLYFPDSPVNILGVTKLAKQRGDDEGIHVLTKANYSVFTWNNGRSSKTISHPTNSLPEMIIDEGNKVFDAFNAAFMSVVPIMQSSLKCFRSSKQIVDPMASAIGTSKKHSERYIDRCTDANPFKIGETVRYIDKNGPKAARITNLKYSEQMRPSYQVELEDNTSIEAGEDVIQHVNESNIGIVPRTARHVEHESKTLSKEDIDSIICPETLTKTEEEFMHWHHRLMHLSERHMIRLSKLGILNRKFATMSRIPKCASCAFGKAHKRPWRTKGKKSGSIRREDELAAGDGVSVDQLVSAQPGLIPQVSGTLTSARIMGATVFVDHATQFIYAHLMKDLTQDSTIEAKAAFEKLMATHNHKVRRYRADNGRFAEKQFLEAVSDANQQISFCGVGAHHQNAIAERGIKEITLSGRTMLLHAIRHWPEMVSTILWPFALKAACERMNKLCINDDGVSPESMLASVPNSVQIQDFHTWGCPVYILDAGLQSGSIGPPKWDPRSRLGIYVGHSPAHAGSVALVLNPSTGHVSPQYHIAFDDDFTTVPNLRSGTVPADWRKLAQDSSEQVTDAAYDLAQTWSQSTLDSEGASSNSESNQVDSEGAPSFPKRNTSASEGAGSETSNASRPQKDDNEKVSISEGENADKPRSQMPKMINLDRAGLRRSKRSTNKPDRFGYFSKYCLLSLATTNIIRGCYPSSFVTRVMDQIERVNRNFDGSSNVIHPFAFTSSATDNEAYSMKEMLKQPDVADFVKAMIKEVQDHEDNGHWELVPRSSIGSSKTILAIWSFKRKRFPDGSLNKHKARLCAHGGMQQWGINYWETYAPVVNWISVRILLSLSVMQDLPTTAIDFVLAFPQATLSEEEKIYMELPYGMQVPGRKNRDNVLKLKKNLYGLKQAGLNWFEYLKKGLEERDFKQSAVDPCVFYRHDAILLTYVDDCIVLSKKAETVDEIVDSLKTGTDARDPGRKFKYKYTLTNDGSIKNYLGVEVVKNNDNSIQLKQKFLIERIIDAVNLNKDMTNSSKPTPVTKPLLHKDREGLPRKHEWNYRSLVGMLGYLQGSTRPDISMATHQCARFNNDPKLSHERALYRIVRYLVGTQDKGLTFKPDDSKGLECYVDADFSGNWTAVDSDDPENVLSRTGYIIYFAGCPIHWVSKLQTEIALSTTESEYIALSQSMRDVIPMMNLLDEFREILFIKKEAPSVKCTVFEDNTSCISVATAPSMTSRTKHIALKYHHFRSFVKSGAIKILPIGTAEQTADILTKPLSGDLFLHLRKKMMGW